MDMYTIKWLSVADRYKKMYLDKKLGPLRLNSSQYMYVIRVCESPGITQDQFMISFYVHPSNVTRAILALEKGGFLVRKVCEEDKRTCRLYPTEHSLEIYPRIKEASRETRAVLLEGFSEEEKKLFDRLLEKAAGNIISRVGP